MFFGSILGNRNFIEAFEIWQENQTVRHFYAYQAGFNPMDSIQNMWLGTSQIFTDFVVRLETLDIPRTAENIGNNVVMSITSAIKEMGILIVVVIGVIWIIKIRRRKR